MARMPVLFVGHGSPMNAVEDNEFTQGWEDIAKRIPAPKAILCVSAHWLREGTAVTAMPKPKTIHDFYGFPEELYAVRYNAPGSAELAKTVQSTVTTVKVGLDQEWGLDHGTWSVLRKMYPAADIPTLQLSLDYQLPFDKAVAIGKELATLRGKGVLIIGSGNVVHNLMRINPNASPFAWAVEFDAFVKKSLTGDRTQLLHYEKQPSAPLAHPTNDHYLPLLYSVGAADGDKVEFFNEGVTYGSLSMRCAAFGLTGAASRSRSSAR
jgi:4,5-DOPA dioxygenase extradiol